MPLYYYMTQNSELKHIPSTLRMYSFFVLYLLLTEGPLSGYEIAQRIKERSYGYFKATFGNVYPNLHELKEKGDVIASEPTGGREKVIYTITGQGRRALRAGALEKRNKIEQILKIIDEVVILTADDYLMDT